MSVNEDKQSKTGRGTNLRKIFITAEQQVAIYGVASKFKISEKSAILLALSKGLREFDFMTQEEYDREYMKRTEGLVDKVRKNREKREQAARVEEAKQKYDEVVTSKVEEQQLEETVKRCKKYLAGTGSKAPEVVKIMKKDLADAEARLKEIRSKQA